MGKGNIRHRISRFCLIRFHYHRQRLQLTLRPEIWQALTKLTPEHTESTAYRISRLPFSRLFIVNP
jgi:hypothetical protein